MSATKSNREASLVRYHRLREAGLCPRCQQPNPTELSLCPSCHAKNLAFPRDPEKRRASRQQSYHKLRDSILEAYGNRCACCGDTRWYVLQIEHVNGGGAYERKELRGHYQMLKHIKESGYPPRYQLLCANCHSGKTVLGECPKDHPNSAYSE